MLRATLPPPGRLDLGLTLSRLRHGLHDPTVRAEPDGWWWATRTPDGPATLHLAANADGVVVHAWGPGAEAAVEAAPALLGFDDDPAAFRPDQPLLRDVARRLSGLRIGRTGAVFQALLPAIVEQKVTGIEAFRSYAALCHTFGEPAPGPAGLVLQPEPDRLAALPYFAFHPLGIERRRAETIRAAAARAARLERLATEPPDEAIRVLTALPGIGPWTAAETTATALGDPDAVPVGDYHLPNLVAWNLAGEPRADDARMLELLEPYRGNRGRVIRLLEAGGATPPRFGPRARLRSIARI